MKHAGTPELSDHTLLMLGILHRRQRDFEQATAYLQQLLQRAEAQQNRSSIATTTHHLAWIALKRGDVQQARSLGGRAIALYEAIGDVRGISDAQEQIGLIDLAEGKYDDALARLERSLDLCHVLGNAHGMASSLGHRAFIQIHKAHLGAAVCDLWRSLCLYWRIGMLSRRRLVASVRELGGDWMIRLRRWMV